MNIGSDLHRSEMEVSKTFPIKKPPELDNKFPFRNLELYKNLDCAKTLEKQKEIGFIAEQSLKHLEATGRKPDLQRVPWFRSTWRRR